MSGMRNGEKVSVVGSWVFGAGALAMVAFGCGGSGSDTSGPGLSESETVNFRRNVNAQLDLLFVIDNASSTTEVEDKLYQQIPTFLNVLQSLPAPLDLHVAVVTTDMGAPGDSTASLGCKISGDDGAFQSAPRPAPGLGTSCATGLQSGATYLADDGNGATNFTGPIATALQCILPVGSSGCGFDQPLAALDRALGADGSLPSANQGFLRPDAYLAIILLATEDDCSAPQNTRLFSLNVGGSNQQNIMNALGPIARYRCDEFGHLCKDPASSDPTALIEPPLNPPADAQGTAAAPTLDLADCQSNDATGLTTPVSQFVDDIKGLKRDPDNQIIVAAIAAPATPYTVAWIPEQNGQNTQPGELWPEVLLSCGPQGGADVNPENPGSANTTDGSAGAPAVRITQFVNAFPNSALASVCDPSYVSVMQAVAGKVAAVPLLPCLTGKIQLNAKGLPDCSVTAHIEANQKLTDVAYENCATTGNAPPCWTLDSNPTCSGQVVNLVETTSSQSGTITCSLCPPGVSAPGC
jgi:hypothetical protein